VPPASVVLLADDLIWGTRLAAQIRAAGAEPVHVRDAVAFERSIGSASVAVVDLTARAYDGVEAIERAAAAGLRVVAVGQHDDVGLRKRALAAGAERVYAYRKLFEDGPATLARLLESPAPTSR
jgi:hypothetical protein